MNCTPDIHPPWPDAWPRVIVLIIVLVGALAGVRAGYPAPDVITMIAGAGLAAARVGQALFPEPGRPALEEA